MGNCLDIKYRFRLKKEAIGIIKNTMNFQKEFSYSDIITYKEFEDNLLKKAAEYNRFHLSSISLDNILLPAFVLYSRFYIILDGLEQNETIEEIEDVNDLFVPEIVEKIKGFFVELSGDSKSAWKGFYAKERLISVIQSYLVLDSFNIIGEAKDEDGSINAYLTLDGKIDKWKDFGDGPFLSTEKKKILLASLQAVLHKDFTSCATFSEEQITSLIQELSCALLEEKQNTDFER